MIALLSAPALAALTDPQSAPAETSALDFAIKTCQEELASTALHSPQGAREAQRAALVRTFGNAMESAFDTAELRFDDRCVVASWFGKFATEYYGRQLAWAIFENPFPNVEWNGQQAQVNCPAAMTSPSMLAAHPEFAVLADNTPETHGALAAELVQHPDEIKKTLNSYFNSSLTNYPKLRVEEVSADPEKPGCVSIKAVSAKENGGYGYGRIFHFCPSLQESGCGKYFDLH